MTAKRTICPEAPATPVGQSVDLDGSISFNCPTCGSADVSVVDGIVQEHPRGPAA